MTWTGSKDLKAQLSRLWERGELLRDAVIGHTRFPLRLTLKGPASQDVTYRFEAVRAWAAELANTDHLRLEWQDVRHRVQGSQHLPASAWVESIDNALAWLGRRRDWERFHGLVEATRSKHPALLPWLVQRPLQALALAEDWHRLLAVVDWVRDHPRPNIYLRQVDLPGVHTKFIEMHRSVLSELLDLALPADAINITYGGFAQFATRYGFVGKPTRIRMRMLDKSLPTLPGTEYPDVAVDADNFSRMHLPVGRVFITENEINFLAFPPVPDAIVIFGAGYGWEALARSAWLSNCALHYWGDIDTHGFAILDQLRSHFAHVESFLMDRDTLEAHAAVWGVEDKPFLMDLNRLTFDERALYDDLRDGRIRTGLRLEQEHIGFNWVKHRLRELGHGA